MNMTNYIQSLVEQEQLHKMEDSTNDQNIENLGRLMDHFYLDDRSHNHVMDCIKEPIYPVFWNREMNRHHRLITPITPSEDSDEGWKKYEAMIVDSIELSYVVKMYLCDYKIWSSGRLPDGQKLFKFLSKKGFNQSQIEELTTARNTSSQYLVVSKNPVDWLFMATHQSFTSCMSLNSHYDGAFYMGIPELMVDPFKFMVFVTNGKLRRYTTKDLEFKHFRYINRSIAIYTDQNQLGLVRYYPNKTIDYIQPLKGMGISALFNNLNWKAWKTNALNTIPSLSFENGGVCQSYRDHGVMWDSNYNRRIYYSGGSAGSDMNLCWGDGFEEMQSIEDVADHRAECHSCNDHFPEDEMRWVGDDRVCDGCIDEYYRYCESCDEYKYYEDCEYSENTGTYICDYCKENGFFRCTNCEELEENYRGTEDTSGTHCLCRDCRDNLVECEECGDTNHIDETHNSSLCLDCSTDLENERDSLSVAISENEVRIDEINEILEV